MEENSIVYKLKNNYQLKIVEKENSKFNISGFKGKPNEEFSFLVDASMSKTDSVSIDCFTSASGDGDDVRKFSKI